MEKILTIDEYYTTEKLTPYFVNEIKEFEKVVYEMVKVMNEIHGTNYSYRFWKLLLIGYINEQLQQRQPLSEKLKEDGFSIQQTVIPKLIYSIRSFQNVGSYSKIIQSLKTQDKITYGFHESESISNEVSAAMPTHYPLIFRKGDTSKREKAWQIAERYSDIFYKNVIRRVPKTFVEHFQYQFDLAELHNPAAKVFHISIFLSDFMKILVAKYVENGALLYIYQHGGGAGEVKDRANFHDASMSDKNITWGWKIHDNEVPHKAFRCFKFKKIYEASSHKKTIDVLFAFNVIGEHATYYKDFMKNLLDNLSKERYKNIVARPRVLKRWEDAKPQLNFIENKNVTIESGRAKAPALAARTKIVVTFTWWSPQTLFAECCFVNQPVVSFVREVDYTTIFKPYYDFFIEQKAFHESWESLVDHLNNTDLDKWWADLIKHPMYKSYKHTFVRED